MLLQIYSVSPYACFIIQTGIKKIIGKNRLVEGLHKDGSIFPIRLSVTEVKVVGIRMFIGAMEKVPDKSMILVSDEQGNIMSCTRACEEMLGIYALPLASDCFALPLATLSMVVTSIFRLYCSRACGTTYQHSYARAPQPASQQIYSG